MLLQSFLKNMVWIIQVSVANYIGILQILFFITDIIISWLNEAKILLW